MDKFRLGGSILSALLFCLPVVANADCPLPHSLANGQVADATKLMDNLEAATDCGAPAGANNSIQIKTSDTTQGGIGPLTDGQLVIGSSGNAPQASTLTAGPGIVITNGPGTVTITNTGSGSTAVAANVRRSSPQSIPTYTDTAIEFDSVVRNDGGVWSASNPSRMTAPFDGWYSITGGAHWAPISWAGRRIYIVKNGAAPFEGLTSVVSTPDHNDPMLSTSAIIYMVAGDYVELRVNQNVGYTINIQSTGATSWDSPYFSMIRIPG